MMATPTPIRPTSTPQGQKVGVASGRWPNRTEQAQQKGGR